MPYRTSEEFISRGQTGAEPTLRAPLTYRRHLGTKKQFGNFLGEKEWALCFNACWFSLHSAGCRFFGIAPGGSPPDFLPTDLALKVESAIGRIANLESNPKKKASRNEKCPCGSGWKFKKCHGRD